MKFFFADSFDTVDPSYDFINDRSQYERNRQISDLFAHEFFKSPPFDGLLVSRVTIEGIHGEGRRYSQGQMRRLHREGIRRFLRYPTKSYSGPSEKYPIIGDCGAPSYIKHKKPAFSPAEMVDFYESVGFTHGVSPDHIIINKNNKWDEVRKPPSEVYDRAELTLHYAIDFLKICQEQKVSFTPIGAIQSWSPKSAANYAQKLVKAGYNYLGLGGMVGRNTREIYDTILAVRNAIPFDTKLHIFGFAQLNHLEKFAGIGITSFDSTSPIMKSFKDGRHNYWGNNKKHYIALKITSPKESKISNKINAGSIDFVAYTKAEQKCLKSVRSYADRKCELDEIQKSLEDYIKLSGANENVLKPYNETLHDRPWELCNCPICKDIGIEVIFFRGLNRNKRRGFHNLYVLYEKLKKVRKMTELQVPCIKAEQNKNKSIYSFVVNGKDIEKFASVSRVGRDEKGNLLGYQRQEVLDHINDIKTYLNKTDSILPNSIVIAFNEELNFETIQDVGDNSSLGLLSLPFKNGDKTGWIVDGQQRVAAIRDLERSSYPISVIAFKSDNLEDERAQFVLVNNSRPLPKSLVYELLPSIKDAVPPKLIKRQKAYRILERLNLEQDSPFYGRIRNATSRSKETANIKDTSVLRMIENSFDNGILNKYYEAESKSCHLLKNYWGAVKSFYSDAWDLRPQKSRLTHGVGIISMGYIMDTIAYRVAERWHIPPQNVFQKELRILGKDLAWTDGTWNFSKDFNVPWKELQNTGRHIDLVANFLIRKYRSGIREC